MKFKSDVTVQDIEKVLNTFYDLLAIDIPKEFTKFIDSIDNLQIHDTEHALNYGLKQLYVEEYAYSDRDYIFTEIPSYLNGKDFMQSANDSKHFKDQKVLVEFDLKKNGILWLAVQSQLNYPKWLYDEGWEIANIIARRDSLDIKILGEDVKFGVYRKIVHLGDHIELETYPGLENMWILIFDV